MEFLDNGTDIIFAKYQSVIPFFPEIVNNTGVIGFFNQCKKRTIRYPSLNSVGKELKQYEINDQLHPDSEQLIAGTKIIIFP